MEQPEVFNTMMLKWISEHKLAETIPQ